MKITLAQARTTFNLHNASPEALQEAARTELGVTREATQLEIKRAFRKRARLSHPDHYPNDPDAAALFNKVQTALDILIDPDFIQNGQNELAGVSHNVSSKWRAPDGDFFWYREPQFRTYTTAGLSEEAILCCQLAAQATNVPYDERDHVINAIDWHWGFPPEMMRKYSSDNLIHIRMAYVRERVDQHIMCLIYKGVLPVGDRVKTSHIVDLLQNNLPGITKSSDNLRFALETLEAWRLVVPDGGSNKRWWVIRPGIDQITRRIHDLSFALRSYVSTCAASHKLERLNLEHVQQLIDSMSRSIDSNPWLFDMYHSSVIAELNVSRAENALRQLKLAGHEYHANTRSESTNQHLSVGNCIPTSPQVVSELSEQNGSARRRRICHGSILEQVICSFTDRGLCCDWCHARKCLYPLHALVRLIVSERSSDRRSLSE